MEMTEQSAVTNLCMQGHVQPWPVAGKTAFRMLFVSDDAGERASMAASLASRMGSDWLSAECAGFDRMRPNPWNRPELAQAIMDQGMFVTAAYPRLVSTLASAQPRPSYDCIIVIAGEHGPDFMPLFRRYVHVLAGSAEHVQTWRVPEIRSNTDPQEVLAQLRTELAWLLADYCADSRVA